jgi:FAD-dependent halogenase
MFNSSDYDLIVVGGGPGGSTLATIVAMQGHRVLLLERERHPRYQIGESLLPATIHGICRILGVEEQVHNAGFIRKNGAVFRWGTRSEPWAFGFTQAKMLNDIGAGFAYQVERAKFDRILLDNARHKGVEVREDCDVRGVIDDGGRVAGVRYVDDAGIEHEIHARYVADASGNTSRIYDRVGRRVHSEFFRNVAAFGYFENAGRLPAPNQGNILCEAFDRGWVWFIPLRHEAPSLTSVGLVLAAEHASMLKNPEAAMAENLARCPRVSSMLAGATRVTEGLYGRIRIRRDWSYTNERFWTPGMVLVGDAACFVDPVLSTGVHLATYSALLAGRSINSCLEGMLDEERAFDEFERRYRHEYELFYNFLIAFYDMHQDETSYFWQARKVLSTTEVANEAFVRLVAGGATAPDVYFQAKQGIGDALQSFADRLDATAPLEDRARITPEIGRRLHEFEVIAGDRPPLHGGIDDIGRLTFARVAAMQATAAEGRIVPSPDGFRWAVHHE